jgi:multiple sugar transport system permease protein
VFTHQPYGRHYLNSLYISSLVTVGTLLVSSLSGYAFARIPFPGRSAVFLIVLAGLMIPVEVSIIPNFFLMKTWRFIDTHWPLILLPIFGARSVMSTFMMRQFYLGIPAEIEEAARIDGLDRFGIYARIVMPLAAPAMASVAILTFLNSWNEFLEPLVFLSDLALFTLPLSLNNFTDVGGLPMWNLQLAATTLSVLPILLVYIAAQQRITDSMVLSGVKG